MQNESDIELVILRVKAIEKRLIDELQAQGKNMHDKIDSLGGIASNEFVQRARRVASERNKIAFDVRFNSLQNRQRFIDDCIALDAEITALKKKPRPTLKTKEGCFIATAVYESDDAPEVVKLRLFRDEILSRNRLGRTFIELYYKFSPALAVRIARNPPLKRALRLFFNRALRLF